MAGDIIPVRAGDQLTVNYRTRAAVSGIRFLARGKDKNGKTHPWSSKSGDASVADFTAQQLFVDDFGDDLDILVIAPVIPAGLPAGPTTLWLEFVFTDKKTGVAYLRYGRWISAGDASVWPARAQPALYGPDAPGAKLTYRSTFVNDVTAGGHSVAATPGTGGRYHILYARTTNDDTVARLVNHQVRDGDNNVHANYAGESLGAGSQHQTPPAGSAPAAGGNNIDSPEPIEIAGSMDWFMELSSVAAAQESTFQLDARVWGPNLDIVESGPAAAVITVTEETYEVG